MFTFVTLVIVLMANARHRVGVGGATQGSSIGRGEQISQHLAEGLLMVLKSMTLESI